MFIFLEVNWKELHKKKKTLRKREAKWANFKHPNEQIPTQNIKIGHLYNAF